MKNSNFIKNSIFALLPISLGLGVLFNVPNTSIDKADAYDFSTLPTTITLRDNSDAEIRNYYSALNSKTATQRKGNNLLINLKSILSNGQKYFTYDKNSGGRQIWQMYEITDRDWAKSPASAINGTGYGTYSESTKEIVNYVYGTSTNVATNPYLHSLYVNRDADNPKIAWGYHGSEFREKDERCIEREHIWPKSYGFDESGSGGARGDPMHLWAADGYANGLHNNNPYGYVDKSKKYSDAGNNFEFTTGNILGKSLNFGDVYTQSVFEPQDSDKGDIARACFYMAARYNNLSGTDNSINSDNPYLLLSDSPTGETGTSTSSKGYSLGFVSDLLEWNRLDPVDEYERHRNNLLFNNYTNNRNPFIDFPQWADMIWGESSSSADPQNDAINNGQHETVCTKIEMTTKPSKLSYSVGDTIDISGMVITAYYSNGLSSVVTDYEINPSGKLKTSNKELTVTYMGKSTSCSITVAGEDTKVPDPILLNATNLNLGNYANGTSSLYGVSWTKLMNGNSTTIQGSSSRSSEIHNYISNGYGIDEIKLTIGYAASSNNFAYIKFGSASDTFEEQVKIGNGTEYPIDRLGTFSIKNPGNYEYFQIQWGSGAAYFSSIEISYKKVEQKTINVESVSLNETSLELEIGDRLTLVPTVLPSNATNKNVSFASNKPLVVSVSDSGAITALSSGNAVITVTTEDGSKKATCSITVAEPIHITGISIADSSKHPTSFFIKEEFSTEGLVVLADYSDGTHVDVSGDVEVSEPSTETTGSKKVTVSYEGFSTSYYVSVTNSNLALFDFPTMEITSGDAVGKFLDQTSYAVVIFDKGTNSNAPKYYNSGNAVRVYGSNTITICGPKKIVGVKFIFDSSDSNYSNTITANSGSFFEKRGSSGTWSGNADYVMFTVSSGTGQRRIQKIYVTYDANTNSNLYKGLAISGNYTTTYHVGDTFSDQDLIATASYYDGTTKVVTPTFSGFSSATVGEKTITVSYTENSTTFSTTFTINVIPVEVTLSSISLSGTQSKEFFKGDTFNYTGLIVTANYSNSTSCKVTGYSVSTPDMSVVSNETEVVVKYEENGTTKTASYSIKVIPKLLSISVEECKDKYFVGDTFDSDSLIIKAHFNDNTNKVVTPSYTKPILNTSGTKIIDLSYEENGVEVSTSLNIYVEAVYPVEMEIIGTYKTEFFAGDTFDSDGVGIRLILNNESTSDVSPTSISTPDMNKVGKQDVTVYYVNGGTSLHATYEITIKEVPVVLSSISLSGDYQEEFLLGDDFNSDGLIVTAHYDNGTSKIVEPTSISGYDMFEEGVQEVFVEYEENGKTVENTYEILVISPVTISSIKLSGTYQKEFYTGDDFSYEGLKVTAVYSDGTTKDVNSFEVSGFDSTKVGYQTIKVSYEEDGTTVSTTYTVKLIQLQVSYIELSGNYKTEYEVGEAYSIEGLVVTAYYNNSTSKVVLPNSISGYNGTKAGNEIITISYKENGIEVSTRYVVKITDKETPVPPKEETNLPVIVGAAGGGVVGLGAIITIICVVLKKKHWGE